jgi:membrane protein
MGESLKNFEGVHPDKLSLLREFLNEVFEIWVKERPNQLAAALAYFGMVSFAAVLYIAYLIAGIFINEAAAAERLYSRVEAVLGSETATFIQDSVDALAASKSGGSPLISAISFISLLFVAMGLFLQITYVLNRIWGVPLIRRENKIAIIRQRLFAFVMVMALGLLVIVATMVNMAFAWFGSVIKDYYAGSNILSLLNIFVLLGVIVLANAFIYKVLPDVKLAWRDVWPGSLVTTFLMALGGLVLGIYFRLGGISSAFAAAGTFAVLMISIYYFAQIFLFGAVITRVYAQRYGSISKMKKSELSTD